MDSPAKLYVMEVGRDKDAPGGVFRLSPQQIPNAADAPNDFPVAMQVRAGDEGRGGGESGSSTFSIGKQPRGVSGFGAFGSPKRGE